MLYVLKHAGWIYWIRDTVWRTSPLLYNTVLFTIFTTERMWIIVPHHQFNLTKIQKLPPDLASDIDVKYFNLCRSWRNKKRCPTKMFKLFLKMNGNLGHKTYLCLLPQTICKKNSRILCSKDLYKCPCVKFCVPVIQTHDILSKFIFSQPVSWSLEKVKWKKWEK